VPSANQHAFSCDGCGKFLSADSSCGNRHCPTCQTGKSDEWLNKQLKKVLPVNYFIITFTVPSELRELIRANQRVAYDTLFKAGSGAIKKLAKDERHIGCQTAGLTGILHTWTRQLGYHPHVHFIVPGGGLSKDGKEWKASVNTYYIPDRPLSTIYRAKFMELLKQEGLCASGIPTGSSMFATSAAVAKHSTTSGSMSSSSPLRRAASLTSATRTCSSSTSPPAPRSGKR